MLVPAGLGLLFAARRLPGRGLGRLRTAGAGGAGGRESGQTGGMAARWGRLRAVALRTLPKELQPLEEEEAAARLEQERRARAVRLRRVERLMGPPGPPERTLSRAAMEHMRCLARESPEEWPVGRLARSFAVSPAVVARVLRSRFSPPPPRALKQDGRAQRSERGAAAGPAGQGAPLSRAGPPRERAAPPPAPSSSSSNAEPDPEAPLKVIRKGRDFVDGDGNFLYRIPA